MQHIFEHYSAPKDSKKQHDIIMDKARFARLEILKSFIRAKAKEAGVDYTSVDDALKLAPELVSGKTADGRALTNKEKFEYTMLSLGSSAAFAFQLIDLPDEEHAAKITAIETIMKAGLKLETVQQGAQKLKEKHPEIAHILECMADFLNK
ncbi:MAG: hypothetical protein Q8P07_02650 [bacterium]|nr:hypothetical protein [bacterium]